MKGSDAVSCSCCSFSCSCCFLLSSVSTRKRDGSFGSGRRIGMMLLCFWVLFPTPPAASSRASCWYCRAASSSPGSSFSFTNHFRFSNMWAASDGRILYISLLMTSSSSIGSSDDIIERIEASVISWEGEDTFATHCPASSASFSGEGLLLRSGRG